jgi:hypothetical protein
MLYYELKLLFYVELLNKVELNGIELPGTFLKSVTKRPYMAYFMTMAHALSCADM